MNKAYQKFLAATVSTVVVAGVVAPVAPLSTQAAAKEFTDVTKEAYYFNAVTSLSQRGIIKGYEDGTYKPNQALKRSQAVSILAASLGLTGKNSKDPGFKDVQKEDWYYDPLAALKEKGIVSGVTKDSFMPNKTVTRAEMAKMISLAYEFNTTNAKTKFSDISQDKWYAAFVGALVENNITTGVNPTTFAPDKPVTRGQMAAFVFRAENQVHKTSTIETITNEEVTISGKTYTLSNENKNIFNKLNEDALKNAGIKFTVINGTIDKITYLEINSNGSPTAELIFDTNNDVIDGDLKVSGDNLSIKNVTVKGNLEIGKAVQNSFNSDKLVVEGKTVISDEISTQPIYKTAAISNAVITFNNASLKTVEVNKEDVKVVPKGMTTLSELAIYTNAQIEAAAGIVIPKLTVQAGAEKVEINANISEMSVASDKELTLTGTAKIDSLKIMGSNKVSLNTTGEIKQIEAINKDAKIAIKDGLQVGNILLPEGLSIQDLISNFDEVKDNIDKVDGQINPEAAPSTPTPNPNTGGSTKPNPPAEDEDEDVTEPTTPDEDDSTDGEDVAFAKNALDAGDILNLNISLSNITGDLVLPTQGSKETTISWQSSNEQVISSTGKVTRPENSAEDVQVTLTATISKGNVTDSKEFIVVVKKQEDTATITMEDINLVNGVPFNMETYNLSSVINDPYGLSITDAMSSNTEIVDVTFGDFGNVIMTPQSVGTSTITLQLSDGQSVTFDVNVQAFETGMEALNSLSLNEKSNLQYISKVAIAILEGTPEFTVNNNQVYRDSYEYTKLVVAEWMIRKKPEGGYSSIEEVKETFNLVVTTVDELERESSKYNYTVDVLSNLETDSNGESIPLDISNKLLKDSSELDSTITREITVNRGNPDETYISINDGKLMLTKNNLTDTLKQNSINIKFEKNGIERDSFTAIRIIPQSAEINAPVINVRSNNPVQVTKPRQTLELEVTSDYQVDEIIVKQNDTPLTVKYFAEGGMNKKVYQVELLEVNGKNQSLTISARIGEKVGQLSSPIVLEDQTWPIVQSVKKDTANSKYIITFSEPIQVRPELLNFMGLKEAFDVSEGSVLDVTQLNETTFEVKVSQIDADYLEIPSTNHGFFMDMKDKIFSRHEYYIFNNPSAVIDTLLPILEKESKLLSLSGGRPVQSMYIVDGDEFSYDSMQRLDSYFIGQTDVKLSDSMDETLAKIDSALRKPENNRDIEDYKFLGVEGYKQNQYLSEGSEIKVGLYRNIEFFAKYLTPSGDTVYILKTTSVYDAIEKSSALMVINDIFGTIPEDTNNYDNSDLVKYFNEINRQIDYAKELGVTDEEIQELENYDKYVMLKEGYGN